MHKEALETTRLDASAKRGNGGDVDYGCDIAKDVADGSVDDEPVYGFAKVGEGGKSGDNENGTGNGNNGRGPGYLLVSAEVFVSHDEDDEEKQMTRK